MTGAIPHPRERHELVGHDIPARQFVEAERSGRLPHAWLLGGPEGIGKATLAYRFARFLLAPAAERRGGADGLAVDPQGRTARQIAAGAHPNLATVERVVPEDGKPVPRIIPVEAVRKALTFFQTTAANGGRRICLVDSIDEVNANGANALLKTIEEPPPGAVILLVSHAPHGVLPTIRSRCRKLPLAPLGTAEVRRVLDTLGLAAMEDEPGLADRAAALSDGSVGRALAMLDPKRVALLDELAALLAALPGAPIGQVLRLGDKLADKRRADDFPLVVEAVLRWLSDRVESRQNAGASRLAPLAELCENLIDTARSVEVYNLDRRAFIVSTFSDLAEAVRRAA